MGDFSNRFGRILKHGNGTYQQQIWQSRFSNVNIFIDLVDGWNFSMEDVGNTFCTFLEYFAMEGVGNTFGRFLKYFAL